MKRARLSFDPSKLVYSPDELQWGEMDIARSKLEKHGCLIIEHAFSTTVSEKIHRAATWALQRACEEKFGPGVTIEVPERDVLKEVPYEVEEGEIYTPRLVRDVLGKELRGRDYVFEALRTVANLLPEKTKMCIRELCFDHVDGDQQLQLDSDSACIQIGALSDGVSDPVARNRRTQYDIFVLVEPGQRRLAFTPVGSKSAVCAPMPEDGWGNIVIARGDTPRSEVISEFSQRDGEEYLRPSKVMDSPQPSSHVRCNIAHIIKN